MYHGARFMQVLPVGHRLIQHHSVRTMATKPGITRREVAGSFLFRFPDPKDPKKVEVALFRRSAEVRTYQHRLAPVSGSVDPEDVNPLATALREIKEETTLTLPESIELLRKGKPYSFVDEMIGREWSINPFAFRLKGKEEGGKGEEGITIDWEHEGWEWHDPLKVKEGDDFGGVPKLTNSLRRVWPEYDLGRAAGGALTEGLEELRHDHESGARQLAINAVRILRDVIVKMEADSLKDVDTWWFNVRMTAWHLWINGRESMGAAIVSSLVNILIHIEEIAKYETGVAEEKLAKILHKVDQHLEERMSAIDGIREAFLGYVKQAFPLSVLDGEDRKGKLSILTLSSSSSVAGCILGAASALGVDLDLRILESRPLCEGASLASKFLSGEKSDNVKITLYSDASAALAAEGIDMVLLGADRISAKGDLSNKTGSLPAVLSALHVSPDAKIVVLSEKDKITRAGASKELIVEDNDSTELTAVWKSPANGFGTLEKRVQVRNIYFEWVPGHLISAYVTECGVMDDDAVADHSLMIEAKIDRFFEDL